jgi:hypothetical protein
MFYSFFWRERGEKLYKTSRKRAKQSCRSFIFSPALPQLLSLYITMAKEDDGPSYTFHPSNERLYCGTRVQVCFSNPFECPSKSFMVVRVCVWGGLLHHVRPITIEINTSSKGNFLCFSRYKKTKT